MDIINKSMFPEEIEYSLGRFNQGTQTILAARITFKENVYRDQLELRDKFTCRQVNQAKKRLKSNLLSKIKRL